MSRRDLHFPEGDIAVTEACTDNPNPNFVGIWRVHRNIFYHQRLPCHSSNRSWNKYIYIRKKKDKINVSNPFHAFKILSTRTLINHVYLIRLYKFSRVTSASNRLPRGIHRIWREMFFFFSSSLS